MTVTLNRAKYRALRNMTRAIARGDFDAALKWSLIFNGQLIIAKRLSDLRQRRPRRKPRKPAPKPAPASAAAPPAPPPPRRLSDDPYFDRKLREANPDPGDGLVGDEILDAPLHNPGPTGPRTWREFYHPEDWMFEEGRGPPAQFSERGKAGLLKPRPLNIPAHLFRKSSR